MPGRLQARGLRTGALAAALLILGTGAAEAGSEDIYRGLGPPGYRPVERHGRAPLRADTPLRVPDRRPIVDPAEMERQLTRPGPRAARQPRIRPGIEYGISRPTETPIFVPEGPRPPIERMVHEDILNPDALAYYAANRTRYKRFRLDEVKVDGESKFFIVLIPR
jgi:hypothetical protein